MNKKPEYYRISAGRYQEEGKTVVLKGMTGYNLEREYNKNTGFGDPISPEKFISVFEKATKHPEQIKITKIKNKNNSNDNKYKVVFKNNKETETAIIKISPEIAKKHPEYVTRMDNIKAANITYRKNSNTKKITKAASKATKTVLKAGAIFGLGVLTFAAINTSLQKEAEIYNARQQQFAEEQKLRDQQQLDEICRDEYNYNNDDRCLERRGLLDTEEELNETKGKTK